MENGQLQLDQGGLANEALKALLPQVVQVASHQAGFKPQEIANLLWALAKLVENGLLQLDQGGLANGAVTALLPQVVQVASHQAGFTPQGVANLLWALAKLVENGLLQLDQGGLANGAVTALLPQVVQVASHQAGFTPQGDRQPAVGADETGGERTAPAGSGRPGQRGGDSAVAAGGPGGEPSSRV